MTDISDQFDPELLKYGIFGHLGATDNDGLTYRAFTDTVTVRLYPEDGEWKVTVVGSHKKTAEVIDETKAYPTRDIGLINFGFVVCVITQITHDEIVRRRVAKKAEEMLSNLFNIRREPDASLSELLRGLLR